MTQPTPDPADPSRPWPWPTPPVPSAYPGEVWDSSVPPGGFVCRVCRTPTESEPCGDHMANHPEPSVPTPLPPPTPKVVAA